MMKLVTDPFSFKSGDLLDPEDLNYVWRYAAEAVADTVGRRFKEVAVPISFTKSVASGYAHTDNAELLRFRFKMPYAAFVTKAFLSGNITSTAQVDIRFIKVSTSQPPAGCPDPWLSADSTGGVAADVDDFIPSRFQLEIDEQYYIEISGANFTVNQLDLVVHILADRFMYYGDDLSGNLLYFGPTLVNDSNALDASAVALNQSNFTATGNFLEAVDSIVPTPEPFVVHNLILNSAPLINLRTFALPRLGSGRASAKVYAISLQFYCAVGVSTGTVLQFALLNSAGSNILSAFYTATGGETSGFVHLNAVTPLALTDTADNTPTLTASDYYVRFISTGAQTVDKAFGVLWVG
jgi:hypothetical protein